MKIVFSSNISWSIYNFRLPLLKSLQKDGHEIYTVAFKDEYSKMLLEEGFSFEEINLNNNTTNPIEDFKTLRAYYKIYKKIKPDVICHNAIKPNIYGTIAAGLMGIPVVNNISGLGTLFIKKSFSTHVAKLLYKFSQNHATKVFFQNSDDLKLFKTNKLIDSEKCRVIPGSGVNTNKFKKAYNEVKIHGFRFLFVGRLIYDKGIREYVDAIQGLKVKYPEVEFDVLGPLYEKNSTGVSKNKLQEWIDNGVINYLGKSDNVAGVLKGVNCVVLPSYREGLSKVLIEASSMSLPIITTNVPGCRDVVVDNVTGLLCKVKDVEDLRNKMEKMLLLSVEQRELMGVKARERAVSVFDEKIIINIYKDAIYSAI